jgi:carnitine-CoA ligase
VAVTGPSFLDRWEPTQRVLSRVLEDAAETHSSRRFADLSGTIVQYGEIPELTARAGAMLRALGASREVPVAVLMENRSELISAVWGNGWIGGFTAVLNPGHRNDMLAYLLAHCQASVVVADASRVAELELIADKLEHVRVVVVVGDGDYPSWGRIEFVRWQPAVDAAEPLPAENVRFGDPLMLMYTSGTTGQSKGVVMSHHHYLCFPAQTAASMGWGPETHLYTPMPLYHVQAHNLGVVGAVETGAQVTVRPRFSASKFWSDAGECGATHSVIIGATANILLRQPEGPFERDHSLEWVLCAPAPSDPEGFERRFGVQLSFRNYGLTEVNPTMREPFKVDKPVSCVGRVGRLHEVEVLDEHDLPVAHDGTSIGEICVRPNYPFVMMTEYYRNPEATVAAWRNLWFHTGDLGSLDTDGYLYVRGRIKDSIRRRGENVSAVELETIAMEHPDVSLAAAFGVPASIGDEDIKLDVVPLGESLDVASLVDWLRSQVAHFMVPRYIQIRSELPMTPSQRVQKYLLQAEGVAGADYDSGDRQSATTNLAPTDRETA